MLEMYCIRILAIGMDIVKHTVFTRCFSFLFCMITHNSCNAVACLAQMWLLYFPNEVDTCEMNKGSNQRTEIIIWWFSSGISIYLILLQVAAAV